MQKTSTKGRTVKGAMKSMSGDLPRRRGPSEKPLVAAVEGDRWLDNYVPYRLYRVSNKMSARLLKRLKMMCINTSQWQVLSVLRAYGTMSIGLIVEATLMEQPTTSRAVAQLGRIGHVARRLSDRDSRVVEVSLTAAGLEAFDAIVPAALKHQMLAFRGITAREKALLANILKKIGAA